MKNEKFLEDNFELEDFYEYFNKTRQENKKVKERKLSVRLTVILFLASFAAAYFGYCLLQYLYDMLIKY